MNHSGHGRPSVDSWKAVLYDRAHHECETLVNAGGIGAGLLTMQPLESYIATINQNRNVTNDSLTHDPADLTPIEIDEEVETLARALQDLYRAPALMVRNGRAATSVQNGNGAPTDIADLPSLVRDKVEVLSWSQMKERRAQRTRDWVVEGWLARRETSSWSGKVEGGKTTLMRELTMAVLRGEPFLGRPTVKGRVFYAMLDADGEDVTYEEFEKLGFDEEDAQSCQFMFEPMLAQITKGLEQFVKKLKDFKPTLVIIDPYARLKLIEDFSSYSNTYLMGMLSGIAGMVDAHLALPGHIPRGRSDDDAVATAGFGSISFSGGVNARFVVTDRNGIHTIRTSAGKAAGFQPLDGEHVLTMKENHRISLGEAFSWKDKGRAAKASVAQFLDTHSDRPFDLTTLANELQMQRSVVRTAVSLLYGEQRIRRDGDGLRSRPYIYAAMSYLGPLTLQEVKRE